MITHFAFSDWSKNNSYYLSRLISRANLLKGDTLCSSSEQDSQGFCPVDAALLSKICPLFPIQLTKFVRLRLQDAKQLLQDKRYPKEITKNPQFFCTNYMFFYSDTIPIFSILFVIQEEQ